MTENAIAKSEAKRSLVADLAGAAGLEPSRYYATVKEMCGCTGASDENFAGLLMVAKQLDLNPITRQLYLMKTQRGVQVVVPVDGYLRILARQPELVAHTCELGRDDIAGDYAEVTIYTREQVAVGVPPFRHREYMAECAGKTGPWQSHPTRMLKHKAYSQAVRYRFGLYVPDEDEWHRAGAPLSESPQRVAAELTPAVPLAALAGPPDEPDGDDQDFDEEESRRLDAELLEREGAQGEMLG